MRSRSLSLLFFLFVSVLGACSASVELPSIEELPPVTFTDFTDPSPYLSVFAVDGPTIYVATDGSGDYRDLASAVEAAEAGTTIYLDDGIFKLNSPLDIEYSLRLIGRGMEKTKIVSSAPEYVIQFTGNGTFAAEGIGFQHWGKETADVLVIRDGKIVISNCLFAGAQWDLQDYGSIDSIGAGIRLMGDTEGLIQSSIVSANDSGIGLAEQAQPSLEGNICLENETGIYYTGKSGGIARGNEISMSFFGIHLYDQVHPTLEQNIISENNYGIAYRDESRGDAKGNKCFSNEFGIHITDSAEPILEENIITENDRGIRYYSFPDIAGGLAIRNNCSDNRIGIEVGGDAQPVLEENTVTNNETGIEYWFNSGGIARLNECNGNQIDILIDESGWDFAGNPSNSNVTVALEENNCRVNHDRHP
jgi:parallel beta-helix repeat protein